MRPTELLQEIRKMRFDETFSIWTEGRITQEETARMLEVSSRSFRRYVDRYRENGIDGLIDKLCTFFKCQIGDLMEHVDQIDP